MSVAVPLVHAVVVTGVCCGPFTSCCGSPFALCCSSHWCLTLPHAMGVNGVCSTINKCSCMQHSREHLTISYVFCNTYQALLVQSIVYRSALFSVAICCEESQTKNWAMQLIYTKVGCNVLSVLSVEFLSTIILAVVLGFVVMSFKTVIPWTTAFSFLHVPSQNHTCHYTSSRFIICFVTAVSFIYIPNESVNLL